MTQIYLDDISEAVRIADLKNFDGIYESLGGGEINDTFLLKCSDEKIILRISKNPDQNTLINEARALNLLKINQVPKLIYFDKNNRIKERQWIIESYIVGSSEDRLSIVQFNNLGKLLANVNGVKSGNVGINAWNCFLDDCKKFGDEQFLFNHPDANLKELVVIGRKYCDEWQNRLNEIPESLIHGDATPSNILVQNNTVSLIDWEFSKFNDPMAEFSTIFYEDMEYNQGKWRVHITNEEKTAFYDGYTSAGGIIDEERIEFWMNIDKLRAAVFLYWRINQSNRKTFAEQIAQYELDLTNLIISLHKNLKA